MAASKDASSKALRARAIVVPVAGARCKFYDPLENLDSRRKGDRRPFSCVLNFALKKYSKKLANYIDATIAILVSSKVFKTTRDEFT